ncbi:MAG: c-type cytochrome [Methyloligellaceae bacterium]
MGRSLIAFLLLILTATAAGSSELRDYGEHLAGECTTCHRIDGKDNGIPAIVGWDVASFVETVNYYKKGLRKNQAMESVARTLDEEQIKALAVYFASVTPKVN